MEELWSDTKLNQESNLSQEFLYNTPVFSWRVVRQMRDELQARIDELEEQVEAMKKLAALVVHHG